MSTMFDVIIEEETTIARNKSRKFANELALKDQLLNIYNALPNNNKYNDFNDFVVDTIGRELDL